jgi:hypothetical protein
MTVVVQSSESTVNVTEENASVIIAREEPNEIIVTANGAPIVAIEASTLVELDFFGNGPQGVPGPGIIPSGTTGQVLAKTSSVNYDTQWKTLNISDMADVNVTNKTDGSVLVYDGNSQQFVANSSFTSLSLTDGGNY